MLLLAAHPIPRRGAGYQRTGAVAKDDFLRPDRDVGEGLRVLHLFTLRHDDRTRPPLAFDHDVRGSAERA